VLSSSSSSNSAASPDGDGELTVDVGAIVDNYRSLAARIAPARAAAVVKADAYGTGIEKVAPALAAAGVSRFFVAQAGEGVRLRKMLAKKTKFDILVFGGLLADRENDFLAHDLIPVLNSLGELDRWAARGRVASPLRAAIHIDTGMNRLGLNENDVEALSSDPERFRGLEIVLVMSHLACTDTPEHPMNRRQLERFKALRARLPQAPASLANTGGILLGADYHFDWVRPGIGLYGGNPVPSRASPVKPVVSLKVPILQIRRLAAGETTGYGASFTVQRDSRLAVLSAGYADGLMRSLSNRGRFKIDGQSVPIVGRVSMDLIAVDVTDIHEHRLQAGRMVEILGVGVGIDELALDAGTISYEMLTLLGQRYRRRYVGAGGD